MSKPDPGLGHNKYSYAAVAGHIEHRFDLPIQNSQYDYGDDNGFTERIPPWPDDFRRRNHLKRGRVEGEDHSISIKGYKPHIQAW